jgi:hypothetical protein
MSTIHIRFEVFCKDQQDMVYIWRGLCENACSEMMVLLLVVARSPNDYICHVYTSLPFVLSQELSCVGIQTGRIAEHCC